MSGSTVVDAPGEISDMDDNFFNIHRYFNYRYIVVKDIVMHEEEFTPLNGSVPITIIFNIDSRNTAGVK